MLLHKGLQSSLSKALLPAHSQARCPSKCKPINAVLSPGPAQVAGLQQLRHLEGDLRTDAVQSLELRDVQEISFVSRRRLDEADFDPDEVDAEGLPLVYNEKRIADYWKGKPGELAGRWTKFAGISAPWLLRLFNAVISGQLEQRQGVLARDAVGNLERLGPTFIKVGQIASVRPDVMPPPVMAELAALQDNMPTFPTIEARRMVEHEFGRSISDVFSEFGAAPMAAASLAQVYRARLKSTGEEVAVKVQRPGALQTISKDLYVMRRAVGIYERIVRRFTAQTTDYQRLLSTFAEGLYTEMDFRNEALNSIRMQQLLSESGSTGARQLIIPKPHLDLTTRRVLTMEWVTGVKLTTLQPAEICDLVDIGQEVFLTQLLEIGYMHGDPHPGNLLKVTEGEHAGKLCLLDFGLVAEIPRSAREAMISATIHLANRDWDSLITDFINLKFLPPTSDRARIIPVMDRVLSPYLRGGGAKGYMSKSNFQALSQDLLATTMQIPFSVPPYMSLLARSVATLEGIALLGDPNYQMVAKAYPFVVRRILTDDGAASALLLRDLVYDARGNVKPTRLSALLNAAMGRVAAQEATGFVDFDAVPEDGASAQEVLAFLASPAAHDLRPLLIAEAATGLDLWLRDRLRRAAKSLPALLAPQLPLIGPLPLPRLPSIGAVPLLVPGLGLRSLDQVLEMLAPRLAQGEEVQLQSLVEVAAGLLGIRAADLEAVDAARLLQLALQPTAQVQEMQQVFSGLITSPAQSQVAQNMTLQVLNRLAAKQATRAGMPAEQLFPGLATVRQLLQQPGVSAAP